MPHFTCNMGETGQPFPHFWEHTVGSGYAPLALRADWQAQLKQCHHELGFRHVRFHGILHDDIGTLITHAGELLYSFFNADQIMDFLLSIGMRPFVELSFMPWTLASGNKTVFSYRGNVTPPKDYEAWATLIRKLVEHWVERYGLQEVRHWYFEVWNEPNLHHFWTGAQADYFNLYRHTVNAIKGIDESLVVGGPATAQNEWIAEFLEFCQHNQLPADFVSTHYYPTDAFGKIGSDTETQLANAPPGVMRDRAKEAHRHAGGRPLFYTEWNVSSNPRHDLHDKSFAAAFATLILMNLDDLVQGYSFWKFSDIFTENYCPYIPFHGGFGLLNLHCIAKPVYRAFELLHRLGDERLEVDGSHETVDTWVIRGKNSAIILIINHAQPRHEIQTEQVGIHLLHAPEPEQVMIERIDEDHANPRRLWVEMGEPKYPTPSQVQQLQDASRLAAEPHSWQYEQQTLQLDCQIPPQGVAAITVRFRPQP